MRQSSKKKKTTKIPTKLTKKQFKKFGSVAKFVKVQK